MLKREAKTSSMILCGLVLMLAFGAIGCTQGETNVSEEKVELKEDPKDGVYSYTSNVEMISPEQAVDLVASIIMGESDSYLELVQEDDKYYYQMNPRKLGDQLIINKLECRDSEQEAIEHGYYEVTMYEDIIDDIETGEGHQAITANYSVDLIEHVIVKEDYK